jgi:hypothetical protein
MQHHAKEGSAVPIVGLDYFFMTEAGVQLREEIDMDDEALQAARSRGEAVKCLICRCHKSKAIFAHVVPCKGADEQGIVADMVVDDIEWLGHTRIILKTDNEPAVQALAKQALELAKVEVKELEQATTENPPAYDSQANGGTEVGVRVIRGMMRTLKLCLEQRLDKHIPVSHPVMAWLLEHVCTLLTATVRGEDGSTAWMRVRGRPFAQQLIGFGESVLHKYPTKGPRHDPHGNVGALGADGVFLGFSRYSNTFMIWTGKECVPVRSVTRKPESDRWLPEAIADVTDYPGKRRVRAAAQVRFDAAPAETGATAAEAAPTAPRAMRIDRADLEAHGYSEECPQCKHILKYKKPRSGTRHSNSCRQRIMKAMEETDAGRARLQNHNDRLDRTTAEQVEWQVNRPTAASADEPAALRRAVLAG